MSTELCVTEGPEKLYAVSNVKVVIAVETGACDIAVEIGGSGTAAGSVAADGGPIFGGLTCWAMV